MGVQQLYILNCYVIISLFVVCRSHLEVMQRIQVHTVETVEACLHEVRSGLQVFHVRNI